MSFYVGQKVKCIREEWVGPNGPPTLPLNLPKLGTVYTVRGVSALAQQFLKADYIWVFELTNPALIYSVAGPGISEEVCFRANHFVPVDERKTDISVFTEILNKTKAPAKVSVGSDNNTWGACLI